MGYGSTGHNYASFADMQAGGLYEAHGRVLGASLFASGLTAPTTYKTAVTPTDAALSAGSDAIDHGIVIPNVTDGYNGAGPDLGAQETGCGVPIYGVRPEGVDETTEPTGCAGSGAGGAGGSGGAAGQSGGGGSEAATGGTAGSHVGGSAGTVGGAGGNAGTSSGATPESSDDSVGCGCRIASTSRSVVFGAFIAAAFAMTAIGRRRSRRNDAAR